MAQPAKVLLGTATPGGGFPAYGAALVEALSTADSDLVIEARNTKGSTENVPMLERGDLDLGLVTGEVLHEALAGIGRPPANVKVLAAMYSQPGMFVVRADSPARRIDDLKGKPIAFGAAGSGLVVLARYVLDGLGLATVVKTSGSKGLQLYLPLNTPTTYGRTAGFSRTVAQALESSEPRKVVSAQRKDLRRGKVLVDWSQNSRHKTTVCAYSLRATESATVSTPLDWDEIEAALAAEDPERLRFTTPQVLDRVERLGDPAADDALAAARRDLDALDLPAKGWDVAFRHATGAVAGAVG